MQLKLSGFNDNKTTKERKEESIASDLRLKGLECIPELSEILSSIFLNYTLEKGIFRLKNEICEKCDAKLTRKGTYEKEIFLPGGARLLLTFYQYSCNNCKEKVDRKIEEWFKKGDRYSSNVKCDAVRMYLNHLSSYESVQEELIKLYGISSLSKRTVRKWLSQAGIKSSNLLLSEKDFSGHFIYDEEYLKVFVGDVGKKGSKLEKIEVYLLLFRDAVTQNIYLTLSNSLDKLVLKKHWQNFARWTIKKGIKWLTLTTDGKKEYNSLVDEINDEFSLNIRHAYCVFHFKKNLFETSNYYLFGVRTTKKELPLHVKNQIMIIEAAIDMPSASEFEFELKKLLHQINTFIPPLQDQIKRLNTYKKNYALHKEFPFLRTTNICEHWFGQTKPQKIKKGYKTKEGILLTVKSLAIKYMRKNWKELMELNRDFTDATNLLISSLH